MVLQVSCSSKVPSLVGPARLYILAMLRLRSLCLGGAWKDLSSVFRQTSVQIPALDFLTCRQSSAVYVVG